MEQVFEEACKEHIIPGAVLLAANGSGTLYQSLERRLTSYLILGTFKYENVFGSRSLKDISAKNPLKKDDIMWTASCTKLMTSIAALQLVERGSLSLDEDVASILPELTNLDILTGFEDDRPQLTKASDKITLRYAISRLSSQ